jgi:thiaminase (transcriptional activator TenA)
VGRARARFDDHRDVVAACEDHPFVQGIASGQLSRERFLFYVEQDAWFLRAFARAYALAMAKAPDTATMMELRVLLEGVFEELELHGGYAEQWGADLEPEPAQATLAYTDFLLRVAWSEPVAAILAAMTPCMRLYAHLGQHLAPTASPDSPYHEWVTTYAGEEFEALARRMEALLDAHDDGSEAIAEHYRTAMLRERQFFDQAAGER